MNDEETREHRVRKRYRLPPGGSVRGIPKPRKQVFYFILLDSGWDTTNAKAVRNNKEAFGNAIGEHVLIELSTKKQIEHLYKSFSVKGRSGPYIIITDIHPEGWTKRSYSDLQGIVLDLAAISERDVAPLLQTIASEVNDTGFMQKVQWRYRLSALKKRVRADQFLDVVLHLLR